jgi:hypothetical protein
MDFIPFNINNCNSDDDLVDFDGIIVLINKDKNDQNKETMISIIISFPEEYLLDEIINTNLAIIPFNDSNTVCIIGSSVGSFEEHNKEHNNEDDTDSFEECDNEDYEIKDYKIKDYDFNLMSGNDRLMAFATNYNFLRIASGMTGLSYSN